MFLHVNPYVVAHKPQVALQLTMQLFVCVKSLLQKRFQHYRIRAIVAIRNKACFHGTERVGKYFYVSSSHSSRNINTYGTTVNTLGYLEVSPNISNIPRISRRTGSNSKVDLELGDVEHGLS
jgi:hypothetical protein